MGDSSLRKSSEVGEGPPRRGGSPADVPSSDGLRTSISVIVIVVIIIIISVVIISSTGM